MDNEKILTRIRRLLAMAADTSSPNEAAIAASRARALMDKHQISEWHLKQNKPEDFGTATQLNMDRGHGMIALAMARLNDCIVQATHKDGFPVVEFSGYLVDTVTAKELYLYLVAQCEKQLKIIRGNKVDFRIGFGAGVQAHVREIMVEREALKVSDGRSLVVCKRNLVTERFGHQATSHVNSNKTSANYQRGYASGKKAGLSRQVSTNPVRAKLR